MSKIIGLTGGIGSGKTTVANLFRQQGIPVYIADDRAKAILYTDAISHKVIDTFGDTILSGGKIDRAKLASIVFGDKILLEKLNSIVHPAVKEDFFNWLKEHEKFPIVIKEAAILFESGSDKDCDAVITVTAPLEIRVGRIVNRDRSSRQEIIKRIENQWPDEKKMRLSDFIIQNISLTETEQQVKEILKKLQNI